MGSEMADPQETLDTELAALPQALRWREWMARVEAVLFAASGPVTREMLSRVVGGDCSLDLLIGDLATELSDRPYEIARIAGGWQFRTRSQHAAAIRVACGGEETSRDMTRNEAFWRNSGWRRCAICPTLRPWRMRGCLNPATMWRWICRSPVKRRTEPPASLALDQSHAALRRLPGPGRCSP